MAQTGYTPISLYYSATAGHVPLPANLINGELAVNIADGKLFYKDSGGTVQVLAWKIVPATAGGTGITSYAIGDLLYANTTTTLAKLPDVATGNALISNGVNTAPAWGKIGLTTHVTGTLDTTNGGTGISSYATGDILYASATNTLSKLAKPTDAAVLEMNSSGTPSWKVPKYGAFHDTTNQTAAANTPTAITYNSTDYSKGITVGSPTSRIVIDQSGLYNIQFSIQFTNSSASIDDAAVWLRVNGTNVAYSNSWGAVPGKHSGTNGQLIMALNLFYQFNANDYFELIWMTVAGTTSIETIAGSSGTPTYPAAPSVILTVSNNIAA